MDDKQQKIKALIETIVECKDEIGSIKDDAYQEQWKKVRDSLSSAVSFLNKANKEITKLVPMEGQLSIFDYLEE